MDYEDEINLGVVQTEYEFQREREINSEIPRNSSASGSGCGCTSILAAILVSLIVWRLILEVASFF